jgi:hypothetical protein
MRIEVSPQPRGWAVIVSEPLSDATQSVSVLRTLEAHKFAYE